MGDFSGRLCRGRNSGGVEVIIENVVEYGSREYYVALASGLHVKIQFVGADGQTYVRMGL